MRVWANPLNWTTASSTAQRNKRIEVGAIKFSPGLVGHFQLIEIQRISVGPAVFIFLSPLLCFLKLLFEDAIAVFHRAQFLREDLFPHLFLLIQSFNHL